jgi:hypothetical protein
MAMKRNPLPRNTVAKNRSSRSPMRSRTIPMNQRKAIPENGTRFNARMICRLRPGSASHEPSPGPPGTAVRTSTSAAVSRRANNTPAPQLHAASLGHGSTLPLHPSRSCMAVSPEASRPCGCRRSSAADAVVPLLTTTPPRSDDSRQAPCQAPIYWTCRRSSRGDLFRAGATAPRPRPLVWRRRPVAVGPPAARLAHQLVREQRDNAG